MNVGEVSQYGISQVGGFNIYVDIFHDEPETYYINIFKDREQQLMTWGTREEVLTDIRRIVYG
ncbi:MAG: hypothetical protein EAZ68_22580 [Oscillatoriales cyanobacterium]|nr:MAG: hypothetical protein EAZ68_22580 [Oscillatoriales cyanobacterium]